MNKLPLGVLVSGQGTNLQAILEASEKKEYPAKVGIVISNVAGAPALDRAKKRGIATAVIPHGAFKSREEFEEKLIAKLDGERIHLVILAGFMRVLSAHFVHHYPNRIMNIHPALLPAFPGTNAIERAFASGEKVTGVTVHFVDEGTDTGPIILQEPVPIEEGEDLTSLEERIHEVEHHLYPRAIRLCAEGKLQVVDRKVMIQGER